MLVLLGGMPRSGSTCSFNIVRDVLQVHGTVHQEPCEDVLGAIHRSDGAQHVLVTTHALSEPSMALAKAGAMRIIITICRIEDAMASWTTIFDTLPKATMIEKYGAGCTCSAN